jgi:hypothetical protein
LNFFRPDYLGDFDSAMPPTLQTISSNYLEAHRDFPLQYLRPSKYREKEELPHHFITSQQQQLEVIKEEEKAHSKEEYENMPEANSVHNMKALL